MKDATPWPQYLTSKDIYEVISETYQTQMLKAKYEEEKMKAKVSMNEQF